MKIVLASDNENKLREFRELLAGSGVEILSKTEAGCRLEVEETGDSFAENARQKAVAVMRAAAMPALADDSGLCVDALGGAPGVYSARYTGRHGDSDQDRYRLLLRNMEGETDRRAWFVCALCCAFPDGTFLETVGECRGTLLEAPQGENGFGYDPIFQPEGCSKSMGALTPEEKNAVSHRGKALRAFQAEWERRYADQ